jgi:hypothetical protein
MKAIRAVTKIYQKRGFKVTINLLKDGQFEPIRGDLSTLHINLNTVSNAEHVPEVERYIRTTKERVRSVYNTLPFKKMPTRLTIELVYYSVFWLNSFPPRDGISTTMSPRTILSGMSLDYNKHCKLEFGTYVQTHENHDNSMATRTTGAIALRPTGNMQGGYYFYSLTTGRRLNCNKWTALPMPTEVITRVHIFARRNNAATGVQFGNRLGADENDDDDNDDDYNPTDTNNDNGSDDDTNDDTHNAPIDHVDTAGVIDDKEIVDGNEEVNEVDVIINEENENEEEDEENPAETRRRGKCSWGRRK